jgi:hypothetical protein
MRYISMGGDHDFFDKDGNRINATGIVLKKSEFGDLDDDSTKVTGSFFIVNPDDLTTAPVIDMASKVDLTSSTTQLIDSDLAIKNGKKILLEKRDLTQANAISMGDYGGYEQLEIGTESDPLCLNHNQLAPDGTNIGKNILVNWKDENGTEFNDSVAYMSDVLESTMLPYVKAQIRSQPSISLSTTRCFLGVWDESVEGSLAQYLQNGDTGVNRGDGAIFIAPVSGMYLLHCKGPNKGETSLSGTEIITFKASAAAGNDWDAAVTIGIGNRQLVTTTFSGSATYTGAVFLEQGDQVAFRSDTEVATVRVDSPEAVITIIQLTKPNDGPVTPLTVSWQPSFMWGNGVNLPIGTVDGAYRQIGNTVKGWGIWHCMGNMSGGDPDTANAIVVDLPVETNGGLMGADIYGHFLKCSCVFQTNADVENKRRGSAYINDSGQQLTLVPEVVWVNSLTWQADIITNGGYIYIEFEYDVN